ncbi:MULTISPECIES: hypothetical protein [unclassified Aeromonas]|uniref:hypothetical protein n=1 Tax=unclassified Aeromonas TaxID=257493 RepID=UPI0035286BD8
MTTALTVDLTGVRNVMDGMRGCTSMEAREYLAAWKPSHKPAYLTGYPKSRRLARKLKAAAYTNEQRAMNPHLNIGTAPAQKKAGRPATVYRNLVPLRIADLMAVGLDRAAMQEDDDAPEVSGLPVWLDDIISGALVWDDAKSTAHKLSPFWMRKVVMLPVISTACIMELTGLNKQSASRYMTNGILACKLILRELHKQEMAELGEIEDSNGNSPIVYKGTDQSEVPPTMTASGISLAWLFRARANMQAMGRELSFDSIPSAAEVVADEGERGAFDDYWESWEPQQQGVWADPAKRSSVLR